MSAFLAGFGLAALILGMTFLRLWLDQRHTIAKMSKELSERKRSAYAQRQHEERQYVTYTRLPGAPRSPLREPQSLSPN